MLTNNKKSIFAKSSAMVMAVLMVLAVCLTGCADKTAQEAANNAQTTATEAKTAADAVKKALEDHLASLDPVTLEMVNQEIDKALVDYAKTEALSDFVKKGELTDLSNKLADYIKKAELEAAVKALVLPYVKPADLTTEVNKLTDLINAKATKEDITKALNEALAGNATDAELAAKAEELNGKITAVENKVNGLDLDGKITNALVGFATEEYVNEAIAGVTTRLEKLEGVVEAILKAFFTEEDIKTRAENINLLEMAPAEITYYIQNSKSWSENEWNATTKEVLAVITTVQNMLTTVYGDEGVYTNANKALINKALTDAGLIAVFDANNKLADKDEVTETLTYALLRVPNRKTLEAYDAGIDAANAVPTFKQEYEALLNDYLYNIGHLETVGTGTAAKQYQVITVVEKDELEAFNVAYDELLTEYAAEKAFDGTKYAATFGKLVAKNIFKNGDSVLVYNKASHTTKDAEGNDVVWTIVGQTIRNVADGTAFVATAKLPAQAETLAWDTVTTTDVTIEKYGDTPIEVVEYKSSVEGTYAALYEQLDTCTALINTANTTFQNFLTNSIQAKTPATLTTDDDYYNALTIDMCVPVEGYTYATGYLFLALEVTDAMTAAVERNTCADEAHTAEALAKITKLDLYERMMEKVWSELFGLYQSYASTMVNTMLADYISITYQVTASDFVAPGATATTIAPSTAYSAEMALTAGKYTEGFVDAFLNGTTTTFTGWKSYTVGNNTYAALNIEKSFADTALVTYLGALNGTAHTSATADVTADPVATIAEYAVPLRQYLTASVVNVRTAIEDMTVDSAKAAGATNPQDAFVDLLKEAVANLDEVYNRYLVEDYKKVLINKVYNECEGLADLYCEDAFADVVEAMEHYLTGYSVSATSAPAADVTTNKLFPNVEKLVNGSLVAAMDANFKVDVEDKAVMGIDGIAEVANLGGKAMADAKAKADEFVVDLEEMAIKDNFLAYLDTALDNLQFAYFDYLTISGISYEMAMKLNAARNTFDATIAIAKFQEEMDAIAFGTYRNNYKNLLTIVATTAQDAHAEKLGVGKFAARLADVKSSDSTLESDDAPNQIYKPVDSKNGSTTNAYNFVGNAMVAFDEIVNVNANYVVRGTDADGNPTRTEKPLYN